jgi:hypothetical protein
LRKLLLLAVLLVLSAPVVNAVSVDDARSGLADAFAALSKAESAGGDVRELVLKLNSAATLIDKSGEANLGAADQIIRNVADQASGVEVAGAQRILYRYIAVSVSLVVLAAAGLLVWFRGSRLFWITWIRVKRGWRVERV